MKIFIPTAALFFLSFAVRGIGANADSSGSDVEGFSQLRGQTQSVENNGIIPNGAAAAAAGSDVLEIIPSTTTTLINKSDPPAPAELLYEPCVFQEGCNEHPCCHFGFYCRDNKCVLDRRRRELNEESSTETTVLNYYGDLRIKIDEDGGAPFACTTGGGCHTVPCCDESQVCWQDYCIL